MITVIGCDASPLPEPAAAALEAASLVVGGQRHLDQVTLPDGVATVVMGDVRPAVDAALRHDGDKNGDAVVLASGDPGLFGIVRRLRAAGVQPVVHPAVSSVALAFARTGTPWDDALVVSAHGRDPRRALAACRAVAPVAVLTDTVTGPAEVARAVADTSRTLVVCERLGEPDERVTWLSPAEAAQRYDWREPNVVLVLDEPHRVDAAPGWVAGPRPLEGGWALDETDFDHRDQMITKAEVRAWVLARLAPRLGCLVWDVGSGSGSVAVECARFGAAVVAVERDQQQRSRIQANARGLGVEVQVMIGNAPAVFDRLPDPDAVFVGGGGPSVVAAVAARSPQRVVVALAGLERVGPTFDALAAADYSVDGVQLQASRLTALPDGAHRLAATNPVIVVCGVRS
ncbi:MAG: precorrin-6y C5,15-methyltransferase (decarboxylating) subunit CbiE [Actinomycetota bacterium]|nr:precorrin-6y C5,15-methyltransferase (decarboxylating) subunit CbiE [Actinomycetota bacterium]